MGLLDEKRGMGSPIRDPVRAIILIIPGLSLDHRSVQRVDPNSSARHLKKKIKKIKNKADESHCKVSDVLLGRW